MAIAEYFAGQTPIGLFVVAAIASSILVAVVRRWAEKNAVLDIPNERSSHSVAVPRGGGLAIVVVTIPVLLLNFGSWSLPQRAVLAVASAILALVSWMDDLYRVPNVIRFCVHLIAAGAVVVMFGRITEIPVRTGFSIPLGLTAFVFTVLWIAGLTNAYNFMDGIDGIAGVQAVVAGIGWCLLAWAVVPGASAAGAALAGAAFGFLMHNWRPARIFMGDVGSVFIGFLLASLTVAAAQEKPDFFLYGVLLVWPFIFDTAFTFLRRLTRGEPVYAAHRSHLYQRLVQTGVSHSMTAILYGLLALLGLLLAVAMKFHWPGANLLAPAVLLLSAAGLWFTVIVREKRQTGNVARRQRPSDLSG